MSKKLTVAQLKKQLKEFSQDELIYLVCHLYKSIPEAADYINAEMGDQEYVAQLLEDAKKKVRKEFFPARGFGRLSLSTAKQAISSFKKVCQDPNMIIDLQLYYVECGVEFTNTYGDINESFYSSMESMYWTVIEAINKSDDRQFYETFADRLKAVIEETEGIGWGFYDGLCDSYYSLRWIEEE